MSSASPARSRSIGAHIARWAFFSFELLYLVASLLVLVFIHRHQRHEYREMLSRLSADLCGEYAACRGNPAELMRCFEEDAEEHGSENVFLLLADASGADILHLSSNADMLRQMLDLAARPGDFGDVRVEGATPGGRRRYAAARVRRSRLQDGNLLLVGYSVADDERHIALVAVLLLATALLTVAVGGLLGWRLSRKLALPLARMVETAKRIKGGDYSARVPGSAIDREIAELEEAFNTMSEENEKVLEELRMLTDNIAHDLRTPLTRLRAAAEMQMIEGRGGAAFAGTVANEAEAMLEMINTMLEISQTGCRVHGEARERVDLAATVRRIAELYSAIAEDKSISLEVDAPAGPVHFMGHGGRLQRLVGNLVDNAVKFTPPGGRVRVVLGGSPLRLTVANTGPGIAPDDIPHLFKRFWRADASRSLPGNGLGLALVKAIATSYGATVSCRSDPGEETAFFVVFPPEQP